MFSHGAFGASSSPAMAPSHARPMTQRSRETKNLQITSPCACWFELLTGQGPDDIEDLFSRQILAAIAVVAVQICGCFDECVVALRLRSHGWTIYTCQQAGHQWCSARRLSAVYVHWNRQRGCRDHAFRRAALGTNPYRRLCQRPLIAWPAKTGHHRVATWERYRKSARRDDFLCSHGIHPLSTVHLILQDLCADRASPSELPSSPPETIASNTYRKLKHCRSLQIRSPLNWTGRTHEYEYVSRLILPRCLPREWRGHSRRISCQGN